MTLNYELPKSVVHKPKLKELLKGKAVFQDDTVEEIDEIIYCTGSHYHLRYLVHTHILHAGIYIMLMLQLL